MANCPKCKELQAKLAAAQQYLRWALDYIADNGVDEQGTPVRQRGYKLRPDGGYCSFHEKYWDARKALDALEGGREDKFIPKKHVAPKKADAEKVRALREAVKNVIKLWLEFRTVSHREDKRIIAGALDTAIDGLKTALECLEAENTRLKAEIDKIKGIVGHPGTRVLPWDCPTSEVVRYLYHEWLRQTHNANQRAMEAEIEADHARAELAEVQAEVARLRKALEDFDVLPCVNAVTQWDDPPQFDDRWVSAVCKAADLVKAGMLKTLSTDIGRAYAERLRALVEAMKNLISLLDADDPVEVGCYCTDSGDGPILCAWCEAKKALAAWEGVSVDG